MNRGEPIFSLKEIKSINSVIEYLYEKDIPLTDIMNSFMGKLEDQIYFDKSDFMFFKYNPDTNLYEMNFFAPVNWKDMETDHYIKTYMHMDDVLPILTQHKEIASHLFISIATVKRHISTAYHKLGINSQKQLLALLKII